jgi:hypothetical protein
MTIIRQGGPKHILNMVKGKDKVVPFVKQHAMKGYERVEVQLHTFLTSVLVGGEWSLSHPSCLNLSKQLI